MKPGRTPLRPTLNSRLPLENVRNSPLSLFALVLVVLVGGCIYDPAPNVGVFAPSVFLSERNTPEFAQGRVARSVVLQVPAGALS